MVKNGKKSSKIVKETNPEKIAIARAKTLRSKIKFTDDYEVDDSFQEADINNPLEIHTTSELVAHLEKNPKSSVEANVMANNGKDFGMVKMDTKAFIEAAKQRDSAKLRESWDTWDSSTTSDVGKDFTPLLGGPFNKQLYYRDYLRMHSQCFFAFHHDPVFREIVSLIVDFTVGRGFSVMAEDPTAQALWDAFCQVNSIEEQFEYMANELSTYGEIMWWWLPNNLKRISFRPHPEEKIDKGIIPRVRLIDPSNIAEIITVPEDPIKGILAYVWLAPTQYQMYTTKNQPSSKFIYTQIPGDQVHHYKINCMSNEKRGRSDLFPALSYLKRLRDSVNYSVIAQQKAAAWAMDTTIDGNQADIDAYIQDQQASGTIPAAGSEFVHTKAITREYRGNQIGAQGESPAFNWCLNMACMAAGIPVNYLGTHLSGATTRASALVSTEPVAKKFERRRMIYTRIIQKMFDCVMQQMGDQYGVKSTECEIIFPELITQDRSAKLLDLQTMQVNNWFSTRRCAEIAAKEFDQKDYKFEDERQEILDDQDAMGISPEQANPLTAPAKGGNTVKAGGPAVPNAPKPPSPPSGLPSNQKQQIKGQLQK